MKDACRMNDLTGPGLFDDAETPSEMIYDFINVMDAIIRSPHHDVVHASISLGANPVQKCGTDPEDESADHLDPDCHSTLAFSLRNSTRNCPEFIVTGCDPIEGEDIIAIASTVWNRWWMTFKLANRCNLKTDCFISCLSLLPVSPTSKTEFTRCAPPSFV